MVDDEALVREVLAEGLEEHGYDALRSKGADAALAMLGAGTVVDVLLTDYAMPKMDGIEGGVFSLLRKPVGANLPAERIRVLLEEAEPKP